MQTMLFGLALVTLVVVVLVGLQLVIGDRKIARLRDIPRPQPGGDWPPVSVIVPARNEERHIEAALQSLLGLDYPNLEITVVNDRSTDRTGEILDRLAGTHPRLRAVHLTELPPKWLGKNHAMQCGAERAEGTWLLFTDADVLFEPSVLRRALGYAWQHQLDHLAILPEPLMPTWLLKSFVVAFGIYFTLFTRLWKVRDPRSSAHVGVGAFNLVRAEAYRKVGGHCRLAMRPDDDLKLGKLLKQNGFRQDILKGVDLLRVPWYGSLGELIVGLEKNGFAGVEYSVPRLVGSTLALMLFNVWPFVAPCVTAGATRWLFLAAAAIHLAVAWRVAAGMRTRWSCALGFPLVTMLFVFILWRSMVLTLSNRGIRWRDTHYPLADLRANRV